MTTRLYGGMESKGRRGEERVRKLRPHAGRPRVSAFRILASVVLWKGDGAGEK